MIATVTTRDDHGMRLVCVGEVTDMDAATLTLDTPMGARTIERRRVTDLQLHATTDRRTYR